MIAHDFFLAVTPKATARSRCACRGRFPSVYTDPGYRVWSTAAEAALKAVHQPTLFDAHAEGPMRVHITVIITKPRTSKLRFPGGDNDNYEKGVWDAMTKVGRWWKDDKQIVDNRTVKRWALPDEEPGYRVTVEYLTPEELESLHASH